MTRLESILLANLKQMEKTAADYLSGKLLLWPTSVLPQARAAIAEATAAQPRREQQTALDL